MKQLFNVKQLFISILISLSYVYKWYLNMTTHLQMYGNRSFYFNIESSWFERVCDLENVYICSLTYYYLLQWWTNQHSMPLQQVNNNDSDYAVESMNEKDDFITYILLQTR